MKIAIGTSIAGFLLSKKAFYMLVELGNKGALEELEITKEEVEPDYYQGYYIGRNDPQLIQVIETLGEEAGGSMRNCVPQKLKIIDIPEGVDWYIHSIEDGREVIHEKHSTWT